MRLRLLAVVFATGLIAVGAAVGAHTQVWKVSLNGAMEVPARDTPATGRAVFRLSDDGTALHYKLSVSHITNVVAAHIHQAPPGVNGPIVVPLFGPAAPGGGPLNGVIAQGTITAADLTGPLAGKTLDDLISLFHHHNAYVNVHTNDGHAPVDTGPGDFPGGEIRGDI